MQPARVCRPHRDPPLFFYSLAAAGSLDFVDLDVFFSFWRERARAAVL